MRVIVFTRTNQEDVDEIVKSKFTGYIVKKERMLQGINGKLASQLLISDIDMSKDIVVDAMITSDKKNTILNIDPLGSLQLIQYLKRYPNEYATTVRLDKQTVWLALDDTVNNLTVATTSLDEWLPF